MTPVDAKKLQTRLGVTADGILGIGTWTAFFRKLGAGPLDSRDMAFAANVYFAQYGILDNAFRLIHFCGQMGIESDYYKAFEEYASGKDYEGRQDLGNTQPGDGIKFKGRGGIMVTGRANYVVVGKQIGLDLERNPQLLAIPSIGLHASLQWGKNNNLNKWADLDDAVACSRLVNRGNAQSSKPANHESDRIAFTNKVRALVL
jgi:putative chitinase